MNLQLRNAAENSPEAWLENLQLCSCRGEFAAHCDARAAVNLPEDTSGGELAHKSLKISSRLTKSGNSPRWLLVVPEPAPDLGPYDGLATAQPCSAAFYDRFTIASPLFHATAFVAASQLSSREFTTSVFLVNSPAYAVFARIYDRSAFLSRIFYTYSLFMFDMHLKGV